MDYASSTSAFIEALKTAVDENIGAILVFTAGILVWMIAKRWIFGGASRI